MDVCWAALKWPLTRTDQGTVLSSSIFRVQTSLSPHYKHESLVSETWGSFCPWTGISYCTFTTQSRPHLWKKHLQVSSSEIFSLLFFPLCNKILRILVSVSCAFPWFTFSGPTRVSMVSLPCQSYGTAAGVVM